MLLDDINENISNKFKKHDLLGVQIIIGSKTSKDQFEFKEIDQDPKCLILIKSYNIWRVKLFNTIEKLITIRNLRPKRRVLKSYFIFHFWNNAKVYINHCYVCYEWLEWTHK